jgi:hypothetical protein
MNNPLPPPYFQAKGLKIEVKAVLLYQKNNILTAL